jgi:hypothetical protein
MIPGIQNTKTDGNLGVVSDTDRILAIVGTASSGAYAEAFGLTNENDITSTFTSGPLVEAGAYMLARGIPVVLIRGNPSTPGAYGTIEHSGVSGTAVIAAGSTEPDGDYDVIVEIVTGGQLGTSGIIFKYSLDNGVTWSLNTGLGAGLTMTLDRGISFTLSVSTNTFVAGDTFSVTTVAPQLSSSDITSALAALNTYSGEWLRALVLAQADSTILGNLDSFAKSFHADGKYPEVITNTRPRTVGSEDRPTYQGVLAAIAAAVQSVEVSCCADYCEIVSEIDGRRLRMPVAIPYAARLMIIDDSQDAAAKADGALPGVFVTTATGALNYHDERRFPGLDDLGFTTLRTFGGRPISPGVYVNNPRLLGGSGSDYRYFQHSAIVNRVIEDSFTLLQPRLSQSALADTTTGRIRADVAQSIDDAMNAELRTRYVDSKRCSGLLFTLSRTDDVISTDTVHFDIKIVPLLYLKKFIGKTGLVRKLSTT